MRKSKNILFLSLLLALSLHAGTCSAKKVYQITETEMATLENRLEIVKSNNEQLQNKAAKLENSLQIANSKCEKLSQLSQTQEQQLATLNKSFQELSKEERQKLNRLKWERNIAYILCAGLVYAYIKK